MTTKHEILQAAIKATADRGLNYGKAEDNFDRIARLWNAHLINTGVIDGHAQVLDAGDVAMMCALLKIARLQNMPDHPDSWIDLAGYAACGGEVTSRDDLNNAATGVKNEGGTQGPSRKGPSGVASGTPVVAAGFTGGVGSRPT